MYSFLVVHNHKRGTDTYSFKAVKEPKLKTILETFDIDYRPDDGEDITIIQTGTVNDILEIKV